MSESPFAEPDDVVAVIGSRKYDGDLDYAIDYALDGASGLVSGGALNVDRRAEFRAADRGLEVLSYRPKRVDGVFVVERWFNGSPLDVVQHPKRGEDWRFSDFPAAAKQRNWWIVTDAKRGVHALWDGKSSGTAHGIAAAARMHRRLRIWMDGDS